MFCKHARGRGFACMSLKSRSQKTLSPRSPSCANGGGRLRDLPPHRQLQLYQLHDVHVLQAALCQVGVKGPRAVWSCPGTQVVGQHLIQTMLLSFQLGARERDALLHGSLGRPGGKHAVPDAVLRALQPHILRRDNLETCRQLPAPGARAWEHQGLQGLAPKVEKTPQRPVRFVSSAPVMMDSRVHLATSTPRCWPRGHKGTAPK